ncbi:7-deoxyloganetin glucosyltransferase-like isoform X2 [Cucurbita pepo subsp. pepo]|uniref:7-deoxyloganetin glucosyltransferase-like isoform X2 n=1 Tax=Cucurbita pepo subsp. pepo TaxID=3664 RepID=UPI000C9D46C4|nr:7-deoxyloganetin glucosyltransferase-like isoform X2 [Cucurbita pepo subsp. pepo]
MGSTSKTDKPHAVCIPYPSQGHINPMLRLAKLLHHRGFHITFVNTEYNHRRLLRSRGPDSLDGLLDFQFRTIPDGLPFSDANSTQDIPSLSQSTSKNCLAPFCDLISLLNSAADVPPVSCIVGDVVMSFSMLAANDFQIPYALFWTASACGYLGYMHYRELIKQGLIPLKVMTPEQRIECAWGLADSEKPFLWIIRPDIVVGDSTILPPEFVEETKDRSMIASWCCQEKVLNHPSIGGFLTHSGWNSTLESICAGVPMISWPFFAEQLTNCRYCCTEWGIGMEIDSNVKRNEVEEIVRELMDGEKGKKMKENVMNLKIKAEEACNHGGSAYKNLDKLIDEVLLSNMKTF